MKKLLAILLAMITAASFFGCGDKKEDIYNPADNAEYYVRDVVKENMIFDTDALFNECTVYEEEDLLSLPKSMTAIRFKSESFEGKQTYPFAVYGVPDSEKPEGGYPAIVLVHGGAGQVYTSWIRYWTDKGYIAIALDVFGNMLDDNLEKIENPDGGPTEGQAGSLKDSVDSVEKSWVYHNVCNIIRCNNILRSFDFVNPNQIGVTGISWGGVLTCIVSGVDKRFAAFAPVYGAGYLYEDSKWSGGTFGGNADTPERARWIELYDPSSYLPYSTKPMLFVSGVDDDCFSVECRVKSYNLVPGKKFYSQRSDLQHGYFWSQTYEVYSFMEHILRGKETVVKIETAYRDGDKAYIKFKNASMVESLKLVYTASTDADSHKWTFSVRDVAVTDGIIEVSLPAGTTAFTFECGNASINTYFKMSSEIFLINCQ